MLQRNDVHSVQLAISSTQTHVIAKRKLYFFILHSLPDLSYQLALFTASKILHSRIFFTSHNAIISNKMMLMIQGNASLLILIPNDYDDNDFFTLRYRFFYLIPLYFAKVSCQIESQIKCMPSWLFVVRYTY